MGARMLTEDTSLSSSASYEDTATAGARAIWHHIEELALLLLVVLGVLTVLILIVRITRKKYPHHTMSYRAKVERYLAYSRVGESVEVSQALISVISVGIFIYGTYIPGKQAPIWYYVLELTFCFYFTSVWALEYFLAKNKLRHIYSFFSLVDMVTVLPIYDDLMQGLFFTKELYTFQFLRVLRVIRIMRVNRILHLFSSEITRHFFKAFVTLFTFILVVAGFYMNIESNTLYTTEPLPSLKFHETVYFLVVTLTTVGYGDIHPTSAIGMVTVTLVICVGAVLIPYQISVLTEKMSSYSKYNRDLSSSSISGHVICCGHIEYDSLLDFLLEFYHEKYGRLKKEVVVLSATEPSPQLKVLLGHPFYKRRLTFIVGDLLTEKSLQRAKFNKSEGCFIFRPKHWSVGDADTVLATLALKNARKSMLVFPQVVTANAKFRLPPNIKTFMCLEEFRSALLAQSVVCPGFSTLISNLFTSRDVQATLTDPWLLEYSQGAISTINRFSVPPTLQGQTMSSVILSVYETMSGMIIGIEESSPDKKHTRVSLHPPLDTVLTAEMSLIVISRSTTTAAAAVARELPQAPRAMPRGISSTFVLQPEDDDHTGMINSLYKKLFIPDAEDFVTNETDSLIASLSPGVEERLVGMSPGGSSAERREDEEDAAAQNVNAQPWLRDPGSNVPYLSKLRRPDRLPVLPRSDSTSSDENEIMESPTSTPKPYYAALRNLCNTDFGGDWKAMLRGLIETLEKMDSDSYPEVARIVHNLKPLLFQPLIDDIQDSFIPKKGHIVLCGSLVGLDSFLQFYRLSYNTPIVVLHSELPPEHVWQLAQKLPFITFVKGTPFDRRDLEKCSITQASKIIILSNPHVEKESDTATDADSLLAYFDMRVTTSATQILVEFFNESNLRFMQQGGQHTKKRTYIKPEKNEAYRKHNYYLIPEFAAGQVCTYAMVDSVMCQIYYKDYLNSIVRELVFGLNNLSSIISPPKPQPYQFVTAVRKNYCYHMAVPLTLEGHTYLELLRHLLQQDILPIGLYRSKEMTRAPLPYVFTCPPGNTILHSLDKVIVFSQTPPK